MSRHAFEPTDEQRQVVKALAGGGILHESIAEWAGISRKTLEKRFKPELSTGKTAITGLAIATLVKAMREGGRGGVGAACFWLKTRELWTETAGVRFVDQAGRDRKLLDMAAVEAWMAAQPDSD